MTINEMFDPRNDKKLRFNVTREQNFLPALAIFYLTCLENFP